MAGKKGRSGGKASRDWDELKRLWFESKDSLAAFCHRLKIPYPSAKKYLKAKEKKEWQAKQATEGAAAKAALIDAVAKDDPQLLVKALRKSHAIQDQIMMIAFEQAQRMGRQHPRQGGFASAGDASRVALAAAEQLRGTAAELQGIPDEEAMEGWIITKGFRPLWYQRDFIFDLPSQTGAQVFLFHSGIGGGKTRCGAEKAGDLAWLNRGTPGTIYAPTYKILEDTTKPMLFEVIHEKGLGYSYHKSENKMILFGDTPIMFRSLDKEQHLRGPTLGWGWIDEGGQLKNDAAFKIILGRIRHPGATERALLITTTPDGLNWLYDTATAMMAKGLCRMYGGKTKDNIYLPKGFIQLVEESYDDRYAKQELAGEFLNVFTGQAYWAFNRADHVIPSGKAPYYKGLPLFLCTDFNVSPMCWGICQEIQGVIYVIDELHVNAASTELAAREFVARWGKHKAGVEVYGDASGWYKATSATSTDYEIIKQELGKMVNVRIHSGRSNPEVKSRVAAVNGRLRDLKGHRKLFISDQCKETVKDFERVGFKEGTQELDKRDPERTHHTDAIGYFIEQKYPIRKAWGRYAS